jgi:mono/diheme cytochrome c family protein
MHAVLVGMILAFVLQVGTASAQQADLKSGEAAYRGKLCYMCHGNDGEGGFGPDLAGGRGLTLEQFRHTIRNPWGVMLAYTEQQLPDQKVADIYAFMQSKPKVAKPAEWHWHQAPASAPLGQRLYMNTVGCGQCHEPENKFARMWLGEKAKEVNYEYFAKMIYRHTDKYPTGGMGNYNPERVPEMVLREIYKFHVEQLGMRASIGGAIAIGEQKDGNTTYTMTVTNRATPNVGLDAEGMTVFVRVPSGTKVVSGTGTGYKGSQTLASLGLQPALATATHTHDGKVVRPAPDLTGDVVVWKIPKLAAGEKTPLSFTLAGAPSPELFKVMDGSAIHWEKPGRSEFGKKLEYFDSRTPDNGDHERLGLPRMPAPAPAPSAGAR